MRKFAIVFSLMFVAGLNAAVVAQEVKEDTPKKKPDLAMAEEMTKTIMSRMFEKVGLSDEQKQKIDAILDKSIKPLVNSRQEFQDVLTPDQHRKMNLAKKQARKANYSEEDAQKYALKKLKLDEATRNKYMELDSKVRSINDKMNDAIGAILTDEQKEKLPIFKAAKKDGADKGPDKGSASKGSGAKGSGNK